MSSLSNTPNHVSTKGKQTNDIDYFSEYLKFSTQTKQNPASMPLAPVNENHKQSAKDHQKCANSISSLTSDSTLVDSANDAVHPSDGRNLSIASTETLFEPSQLMSLKINEEEEEGEEDKHKSQSQQPTPVKAKCHRSTKSEAFHMTRFSPGQQKFNSKETSANTTDIVDGRTSTSANGSTYTLPPALTLKKFLSNTEPGSPRPSRFKDVKYPLPKGCSLISAEESFRHIENWRGVVSEDGLPNLLVVDVRPFQDYCKSHIIGAVNLCLPSTLLKRATFTLDRCIATLTSDEKALFTNYLKRDRDNLPVLIFYDNSTDSTQSASLSVSNLAAKFASSATWSAPIYVLKGGFSRFQEQYPSHVESGTSTSKPKVMMIPSPEKASPPPRVTVTLPSPSSSNSSNAASAKKQRFFNDKSPMSHGLAHFMLPDTAGKPFFKSRQHEEFLTARPDMSMHLSTSITSPDMKILPTWLSNVIGSDSGASVLSHKFNELQSQEVERLNQALSRHSSVTTPSPETPCFSAGVELGRKNRYKDIFPYEHARVKIQKYDADDEELDQDESYINASYLSYPGSQLRYIAAQGPLEETIGDFWKVIFDHKVPLILSLTAQKENEVEKCAPYWLPGTYSSNGIFIKVDQLEEITDFKLTDNSQCETVARRLRLKIGNKPEHEVIQIQILSWPDYGALISSSDLISLVAFKRYVLSRTQTEAAPVMVHCSAGCGRTGCFCTIDAVIDVMVNNPEKGNEDTDVVYEVISNFRSQRVSMVQNLRQYILIYDTILMFKKLQYGAAIGGDGFIYNWSAHKYDILDRFFADKDGERQHHK
ncbi:hypothetical protein KL918_004526 [Ogataea parapolymorpha]|uniref:protein-tyrosine-phosphatase n=1 Tax=Ogataea parapolymorpha (strain ATCC 26012 / BCRC 20466 / JCM 22074 / NRRL Y-7560 / DL-1) TaxID=871575 RepID=W1QFR8_OGAPD|nr:protein-tyrosine phosphatase [Ogataea parapolymorpha DL-1]ESX00907.1 protein-tyrosine phosphatase [Ogataea parapolymorpha DL-1]KAG7865645.1 hypothetical protein KL918_004526 [Ogataea parapolymorpha]KAG7873482.1 hypothetical protein KL916_002086 [Ogataea parapolymorpha]